MGLNGESNSSKPRVVQSDSPALEADPAELLESVDHADKFEMPKYNEGELVELMSKILRENGGVVTVGKMGSLMHNATNNHSLPAMIKTRFGGLKKLLRRHEDEFFIAPDHPHNPHVSLRPNAPSRFVKTSQERYLNSGVTNLRQLWWWSPVDIGILNLAFRKLTITLFRKLSSRTDSTLSRSIDLSWTLKTLDLQSPSQSKAGMDDDESIHNGPRLSMRRLSSLRLIGADNAKEEPEVVESRGLLGRVIPPEFHCPLSGRIMSQRKRYLPNSCELSTDRQSAAVVTNDGRTFEKSALELWIKKNGNTSPLTGQKLPGDRQLSFVPNVSLKSLIDQFVSGSRT
jgi:hypothetical protein